MQGCSPYGLGSLIGSRVRRLLGGMSRSQAWKWVYLRRNESVFGRVRWSRGKGVWVPCDLQLSCSQVCFVSRHVVS
jgi:hypothetical protein